LFGQSVYSIIDEHQQYILISHTNYLEMLPMDIRDLKSNGSSHSRILDTKFPQYVRRLIDFRQMDFEAAFDQMLNLLTVEPQKV
jgi:hypothetical protein